MIQQNLFDDNSSNQQNPLTDRRVGFIGKFKNRAALVRKVKEFGASPKSKDSLTRDTQILVMGSEIKQELLNRLLCYEHDGWKPLKITETELEDIFKGHSYGYETPAVPIKQISIDMSYYNWIPPVYSTEDDGEDEDSGIRCSSPLVYGEGNPIYGMEIFVPNRPDTNMGILRQIIGNFGGYANTEFFVETNVIMLSAKTLQLLKQGVKDEVITEIERQYNTSTANFFNSQFTSEPDFINWVRQRMKIFPEESTLKLLEIYETSR